MIFGQRHKINRNRNIYFRLFFWRSCCGLKDVYYKKRKKILLSMQNLFIFTQLITKIEGKKNSSSINIIINFGVENRTTAKKDVKIYFSF